MSDDTILQDAIRRDKPIAAKRAAALLAERNEALGLIAELESQLGQAHELIARLEEERKALRYALDGTTRVLKDRSQNNSRAWRWARNVVAANQEVLVATKERQ